MYHDANTTFQLNKDDRSSLGLKNLHKLVVRHQGVSNKSQFMELFTWLEAVISASPLTSISILSDDSRECNFAMPLMNLLAKKPQLDFLNIPQVVLRHPSLRTLFGRLNNLRVLSIMLVDVNVLVSCIANCGKCGIQFSCSSLSSQSFHTSASPGELSFNLSALYLRSSKATCPYSLVTPQLRQTISSLRGSPGYLRRLCQEKQTWKVCGHISVYDFN